MKRNSIVAVLIAGAFLFAGTGPALSMEATSELPQNSADPEARGWYQFGAPVETGNLPMGESLSAPKSGIQEEIEVYESGGVTFRKGIDEGP